MRTLIPLLFCVLFSACEPSGQQSHTAGGLALAQEHCQTCHSIPSPELLDKNTWRDYVLPRMGYMLGMGMNDSVERILYEAGSGARQVQQASIFPKSPLLEEEDWESIQAYFLNEAPEKLYPPKLPPIQDSLPGFSVRIPQLRLNPPSTTLVQIPKAGGLFLGDAHTKSLLKLDKSLQVVQAANLKEGLVNLIEQQNYLYLTLMGSFSPTDVDTGLFMFLPLSANQKPEIILPHLRRPVHTALADLNGDGGKDIIISEFGKWTGQLAWWKNKGAEGLERHILRAKPGATKVEVVHSNSDQLPDLLALFAQGDEGVFLYENMGEDVFSEKKVIDVPVSYGLSSMEVVDWNGDGALDIILTSGDNADYPPVVKPYHGIYIFLNEGNFSFTQSWFYPLPGAYGTQIRDYDQDGDLDIVAISFFPDYEEERPRAFVYLENKGNGEFSTHSFPNADRLGRWIVLDAGDIDQDGDEDIVLGSLAFEVPGDAPRVEAWATAGIPFVVLENLVR